MMASLAYRRHGGGYEGPFLWQFFTAFPYARPSTKAADIANEALTRTVPREQIQSVNQACRGVQEVSSNLPFSLCYRLDAGVATTATSINQVQERLSMNSIKLFTVIVLGFVADRHVRRLGPALRRPCLCHRRPSERDVDALNGSAPIGNLCAGPTRPCRAQRLSITACTPNVLLTGHEFFRVCDEARPTC
jgi:hypothetical protein